MFNLKLQLHGGKGSSTTNVQSYTPTEQEKRLQEQAANYADAVAPNALYLNNAAYGMLKDSIGETQVDFNALNNNAQGIIANSQAGVNNLAQGVLPSAYTENMEKTIKGGVENSLGTMLTDLGSRGILNSSVTNQGVKAISDSASSAMANSFNNNINTLSQLYGQQQSGATAGITAGAAAQEAAQQPAANLWQMSMGLNGTTSGTLSALAGQGTSTATGTQSGGSGLFGGLLSSAAGGYASSWCFTEDTDVKTPEGNKKISKITADDKVIAYNKDGKDTVERVIEAMEPHYADVYTVICDGKNIVSTTLTQPLMLENGEVMLVSAIPVGTELKNVGKVRSIVYSGERRVFDLKITGSNMYYANNFVAKGGVNEW